MVITILGVLTSLGIASLANAVANNKVKSAGQEISAFMANMSNECKRLSEPVCVKKTAPNTLTAYKGYCSSETPSNDNKIGSLTLEAPCEIAINVPSGLPGSNWAEGSEDGAQLTPKVGLTALPAKGYFAVVYGGDHYSAAVKNVDNIAMDVRLAYGNQGGWSSTKYPTHKYGGSTGGNTPTGSGVVK